MNESLLHQGCVGEARLLFRKGRKAAHATHLIDGEDAAANQDLLDLCLLQFVGRIHVGEDEFQVIPAQALADGVAREVFGDEAGDGHDCGAEGIVVLCGRGVAVDVALQAEQHGRQIKGVGDDADEELLPLQPQVGVGATAEAQHFGLGLDREDGHFAGAFDFILPPANEPLVMLWAEVLQPQRILHNGVAGEPRREAVRAKEFMDSFERDLEFAQAERGVGARIQPNVGELFVGERDFLLRA